MQDKKNDVEQLEQPLPEDAEAQVTDNTDWEETRENH